MGILDPLGALLATRLIDNPVVVVGGGRSGTSVLTQALGKHRRIYSFEGEAPLLTDIGGMVYDLEFADESELEFYKSSMRVDHAYIYERLRQLAYESAFGRRYGVRAMLGGLANGTFNPFTKTRWCAKSFPSRKVAEGLKRLFPAIRFIMIHRNGIDVVHSRTKFHGFRDLDFQTQCADWDRSIRSFEYLMTYPNAMAVGHAELVSDPDSLFRRFFDFLGLEQDPAPAAFCRTHQVHPLATRDTGKNVDVKAVMEQRPPPYQDWTEQQRELFRSICSDSMGRMGYPIPF